MTNGGDRPGTVLKAGFWALFGTMLVPGVGTVIGGTVPVLVDGVRWWQAGAPERWRRRELRHLKKREAAAAAALAKQMEEERQREANRPPPPPPPPPPTRLELLAAARQRRDALL